MKYFTREADNREVIECRKVTQNYLILRDTGEETETLFGHEGTYYYATEAKKYSNGTRNPSLPASFYPYQAKVMIDKLNEV